MINFTDEQIAETKKALNCCTNIVAGGCDNCSYEDNLPKPICMIQLMTSAATLINYYEQMLAADRESYKALADAYEDLTYKCDVQAAELARLRGVNEELATESDARDIDEASLIARAKLEGMKEFADDLKKIYESDPRYDRPNAHTLVGKLFYNIDKLIKERACNGIKLL